MNKALVLRPRMSEKTYALSKEFNVYVFETPLSHNKHEIAKAVASQFEVTVTDVRVVVQKGKQKQSYRKRSRPVTGQRKTIKKAYVTLKSGDSIPVFAAIDEAEEKAEKAKVTAEKQSKKAKDK